MSTVEERLVFLENAVASLNHESAKHQDFIIKIDAFLEGPLKNLNEHFQAVLNDHNARLTSLVGDVNGLRNMQSDIADIKADVTSIEGKIFFMKQEIDFIKSQL